MMNKKLDVSSVSTKLHVYKKQLLETEVFKLN